jgi:gluconolactonase
MIVAGLGQGISDAQPAILKDSILAVGVQPVQAGTGYVFTEGPAVDAGGRIFFTDQPNDRIYIWDEKKGISLFKEGCERANGTYFSRDGRLLACADLHNRLVEFDLAGKMSVVYGVGFNGKNLNGPNDLWPDKKGGIYFTDPYYKRDYWEKGHQMEQDVMGVYYLTPEKKLIRVAADLQMPNGIIGTSDGRILYVADIMGRTTWRYDILPDGTIGNKTFFAPSGSDGMTIDSQGNVYLTFGKVLIFNKNGEKTGEINLPESPSNVCFGGKDRQTLFITARTSVYTVRMKVAGVK